jgi:hypothetical protein
LNRISFRSDRNYEWLDIANTYDEFLPVDTQRYVLWRARFDLSLTSGGDGDPTQLCGFASSPLCFIIASDWTELLSVEGTKLPLQLENDWVTWENENYEVYCVPTQAQQSTWGRVKGLYR